MTQYSFWLKIDDCAIDNKNFLYYNPDSKLNKKITTLYKKHYKNLAENCIVTSLRFERYSDNTSGIYLTCSKQETTTFFADYLSKHYQGDITIAGVYGPIILRGHLDNIENEIANLNAILGFIDATEFIQPQTIRDDLFELLSKE